MSILQRLYDSEINFIISCFWDGGFDVSLGDRMNGYKDETTVGTILEAEMWLRDKALEYFPETEFSQETHAHETGYWRAINSAPKQGRILVVGGIIVSDEVPYDKGRPQTEAEMVYWSRDGWCAGNCETYGDFYWVKNPTHWMPLPKLPVVSEPAQ